MVRNLLSVVCVMALVLGLAGTATVEAGPVHYWQFDGNSNPENDVLGDLNLPRISGGASTQTATISNPDPGLSIDPYIGLFDDGSDPAYNPNSVNNPRYRLETDEFKMLESGSWTFEGFFRHTGEKWSDEFTDAIAGTLNNTTGSISTTAGWMVSLRNGNNESAPGQIEFRIQNTSGTKTYRSGDRYDDNQWHHFAVTWDHDRGGSNGYAQLFVDGVLKAHGAGFGTADPNPTGNGEFNVGHLRSGSISNIGEYNGRLDEFRWTYDAVLEPWQFLNGSGDPPVISMPISEPAGLGLLGLALLGLRKRRN